METKKNRCPRFVITAFTMFMLAVISAVAAGQDVLEHFNKAQQYQSSGQPELAVNELKQALKAEPENAFYLTALGLAYIETGEIDNAIDNLSRAVKINASIPDAYNGLGVCYNTIGQYQKSIDNFSKALEMTPDSSPDVAVIHNNLGQNYYLLKQFDKAEEELNKAIRLNDKLLTAYINLGNVYTERGDYEKAIEYHKKAVEIEPAYPLPRNNLAFAYYMLNDYENALAEMQKVLETAPDNKQFKENYDFLSSKYAEYKGKTFQEGPLAGLPKEVSLKEKPPAEKQPEQPEQTREPAPEEQVPAETPQIPETAPAEVVAEAPQPPPEEKLYERVSTGREHAEVEEQPAPAVTAPVVETRPVQVETPAAAQTPAEETAQAPPSDTPAAATAGQIEELPAPPDKITASGDYQRRERTRATLYKDEKEASKKEEDIRTLKERAEDFYRAAKYNLKAGDTRTASEDIGRALAVSPDNLDYRTVNGMIAESEGRLHEAAEIYRRILDENPDHSAARNSLGHTQELLGRPDVAESEYMQAYDAEPTNGCAAANLGSRLAFNGKCEEAMQYLATAVDRQCRSASVLNNLSLCYFTKGDMDNAQQLSYSAAKEDPKNPVILSNFSFLAYKSDFNFQPIRVAADLEVDPFHKVLEYKKEVALNTLTPVETIDFYDVFQKNFQKKTVLVVPYQNPRGTEKWSPTPAEIKTERLAGLLMESGYFNVVVGDRNNYFEPYRTKVSGDYIQGLLKRDPADIVYVGDINRNILQDEERKMYLGLKKKSIVKSTLPVSTTILETGTQRPLADEEITGTAQVANRISVTMPYKEILNLNERAFDEYCSRVKELLMDHYNLIRRPVKKNIVKYVREKPYRTAAVQR